MERADIARKLKELLVERLSLEGVSATDIADDAPLFGEGLGLDSLDAVEIIVILQRNFACDVKQIKKGSEIFRSVNSLVDFIQSQKASE